MIDILRELYEAKRLRSEADERRESYDVVAERARARMGERRRFRAALGTATGAALIAEVKRASPSAGPIAPEVDVAALAGRYEAAGADAISVLTEESRFFGDLAFLDVARGATSAPILRKDFLSTPYEIAQAAAYGADAVLLIVAGLDDVTLARLGAEARRYELDTLVEIHDEAELDRALSLKASVIGVNNRDLRTFGVDLATSERLLPRIPERFVPIAESGILSPDDVARVTVAGARGVLVGETLMRAADPVALGRALKGAGRRPTALR